MRECLALICMWCLVGPAVSSLSRLNTRVWGPGIDRADKLHINLRYFFIEPRDVFNRLITEPLKYRIIITGKSRAGSCRMKIEQIDREDGSAVIRYQLKEPCWDVQISVQHGDNHLGASPYKFADKLQTEYCYCPQKNLDEWLQQLKCPSSEPQILHDLFPYRALNFSTVRSNIIDQYHRAIAADRVRLCHYVIKDNRVYRSCYGRYQGHRSHMDYILLSLARKTYLPDLELFVNLNDEPVVTRFGQRRVFGPLPIFSWCGKEDSFDIVMPSYDIIMSSLEPDTRKFLDIFSVQRRGLPWQYKIPKGFWRGRDTAQERINLVRLSLKHPELLNASVTSFVVHRKQQELYGSKSHTPFSEYFNYRYQISMDGTVVAYKLPYLLAATSVVFKQESKYYEHYYSKMRENVEFVPFKADLSDLLARLETATSNDAVMKAIRDNAKTFVEQHLLPEHILCYFGLLFSQYAKRIVSDIEVLPEMELVKQRATCDCISVLHVSIQNPHPEEDHDEL